MSIRSAVLSTVAHSQIDTQTNAGHYIATTATTTIIGLIHVIHTFLYRRKVVTSEAVAEEVRSRQSLSVIMSQVEQVSFKPRF